MSRRAEIIDVALDDLRHREPSTAGYTTGQWDATVVDLGHLVDFLSAAVYVDDSTLFVEAVDWTTEVLGSRGVPVAGMRRTLRVFASTLRDFPRVYQFLLDGQRALDLCDPS
ncbi:hypothetical protein [Micromonospora sp. Llam0]|uniref:hypothetical protein n=1 Tax=Micromonospora sp. Llam0 TaxID=2485143 RepID=UPI001F28D4A0|nr:hypothetical protein [Micromonospora sp. Llam0]